MRSRLLTIYVLAFLISLLGLVAIVQAQDISPTPSHLYLPLVGDAESEQTPGAPEVESAQTVTYILSGSISRDGFALEGVTIDLSTGGIRIDRKTTDSRGRYSFGVTSGGSYTIQPSMTGHTFSPESRQLNVPPGSATNNFTAYAVPTPTRTRTPTPTSTSTPSTSTVAGHVSWNGFALEGVTLEINSEGITFDNRITDATGSYSFTTLRSGAYAIRPLKAGFTFLPTSRTVDVPPDQLTVDFDAAEAVTPTPTRTPTPTATATQAVSAIAGRVVWNGFALEGATIEINSEGITFDSRTTDARGNYSFGNLRAGVYTLRPRKDGYVFAPASQVVAVPLSRMDVNFEAIEAATPTRTPAPTATATQAVSAIEGRVNRNGFGLDGVTIEIHSEGITFNTRTTDARGGYSFSSLRSGTYTLRPLKDGYTFSPASQVVVVPPSRIDANFEATEISEQAQLCGMVMEGDGGLMGVTIHVADKSATTDESGRVTIQDLPAGIYSVAAAKTGYVFQPGAAVVTLPQSGCPILFAASRLSYTLAGAVTLGSTPHAGVSVTLSRDGFFVEQTTTDSGGRFMFGDLVDAGEYVVRPQQAGYTFSPATLTVQAPPSRATLNFSSSPIQPTTYRLSGRIIAPDDVVARSNVTLSANGVTIRQARASSNGQFEFTELPSGNYTVRPALSGYAFAPATTSVALPYSGELLVFTAHNTAPATAGISGRVLLDNQGLAGIRLYLSNEGIEQAPIETDADGSFIFTNLRPGIYRLRPESADYRFSPTYRDIEISANGSAGHDFIAAQNLDECAVPHYAQKAAPWGDDPLLTNGGCWATNTIDSHGCTLTSVAMVFAYYGGKLENRLITPESLNRCMGRNACPFDWSYADNNCDGSSAAYLAGSRTTITSWDQLWRILDQELNQEGRPVILRLLKHNTKNDTHFVVVVSGQGSDAADYRVHDPLFFRGANTVLASLSHQYTFTRVYVYAGTPQCRTTEDVAVNLTLYVAQPAASTAVVTGAPEVIASTSSTITVQMIAASAAGSVAEMQLWTEKAESQGWQPYAPLVELPQSEVVYARFRDELGNESALAFDVPYPAGPPEEGSSFEVYLPSIESRP